ncbi:MAG: sensor histidine kinase [Draconibacterium sp.]|nr:sensor histidine kinase [Draconibacterium sp.]
MEISHSRIKLDDYFLINDTSVNVEILDGLANAKKLVSSLNPFNGGEAKISSKKMARSFSEILSKMEVHIERLQELISLGFQEEKGAIDSVIIQEYVDFQQTFLEFEKNIHDSTTKQNSNFKRKIFGLLILIFGFLILCLILIVRLINAYCLVERKFVEKSIEIEYKERKRIAADLHDGLGSLLSSIGLYTKLLEKDFLLNEKTNAKLNQIKQLSDMALENLEAAINNLNPSILNRHGLIKSIEILCEKINDIGKVHCNINAQNFDMRLTKNMEINIHRICNELIHNTLKHSGASEIEIDFKNTKRRVNFYYRDNGKGFNPDLIPSNKEEKIGLRNMISRIESFGGTYTIKSEHGKGVQITIQFNV